MPKLFYDKTEDIKKLAQAESDYWWSKTRSDWEIQNSANDKIEDGKRFLTTSKFRWNYQLTKKMW